MADQDRFEDQSDLEGEDLFDDHDDPSGDSVWNEPLSDDTDFWEDTPLISEGSDAQQPETAEWQTSTPEADPLADDELQAPPPRIRKRRIVCGVVFLVLGLIGVLADGFEVDIEIASTIASLVGAAVLLAGLIASERRRREIIQLS